MPKRTKAQRSAAAAKKGARERARHRKAEAEAKRWRKASAAAKRGAVTRRFNLEGWTAPGRHDFKHRGRIDQGDAQAVFEEVFGRAENAVQVKPGYEASYKTLYTGRLVDPDTEKAAKPAQFRSAGTASAVDVDKAFNLGRNIAIRFDETGALATGAEYRVELREILVRVYVYEVGSADPNRRNDKSTTHHKAKNQPSSTPSSTSKRPRYRPTKKTATKRGARGGGTRASSSAATSKTARSRRSKPGRKKRS